MTEFINGTEEINPAKIAAAVAFDLRKEVKTNFRGCRDDTAMAAADVIEGLMKQRAELLDALKFAKKELVELHNEAGEYEYVNYAIIDDAIDNSEK